MSTNITYPVYESVAESWQRFSKIYDATDRVLGEDFVVPVFHKDIKVCWAQILKYWSEFVLDARGIDFIYEAIFHIRYCAFSEAITTPADEHLVLLIEEELCRCGYAFQAWYNMAEFKCTYYELLAPTPNSRGWRDFNPLCLNLCLAGNMANRIMLKNRRPIDWGDELDCNRATFPFGPDYMRYRVTEYKQALSILLPESSHWQDEWVDGHRTTKLIKNHYAMDFTNDQDGYHHLIRLAADRNFPYHCARHLYSLNNVTPALINALWGEKANEMIARCFLDTYNRYKAAKKRQSKKSRYSSEAITKSWLYQWVEQHYRTGDLPAQFAAKLRKAQFNIAMNI